VAIARLTVAPTLDHSPAEQAIAGISHAECLKALWSLSTQYELDDDTRIRAVLRLAAEALGMDVVILGKFDKNHTLHYVYDSLNTLSEGMVVELQDSMCLDVFKNKSAVHIADLKCHPLLQHHKMVTEAGMQVYSGLPVNTGKKTEWVLAFLRRSLSPAVREEDLIYMELVAGWLGSALYQSEQKELLEQLALTDMLTGLPNRRAAEERLNQELARALRKKDGFALAMVLKEISTQLMAGLRDCDWVARWGGEKFLFFLHESNAREAVGALERLFQQIKTHPVNTKIGTIPLTLSAGVGVTHPGRYEIQHALNLADISLRAAKAAGRDRVHAILDVDSGWSIQTVKNAVQDNKLRLATQVIMDLNTGLPVADESLARLATHEGELIEAERFIGMAEGLGIIADLDQYMAQLSMARCKERLDQGGALNFSHFINLSPQFLARRDYVDALLQTAQTFSETCIHNGESRNPLVLEITERQRIGNLDTLRTDLQPLLDFGFRLALDDFGSGYSSYMYMANLPISFLKIEGWLVHNMQRDHKIASIVESIASFAHKEGIKTIAEHVEDAETARILREMGVDWGQGWFFGHPQSF
jgi:EAL domain-containing protein (putative c-di-GMP-specific phosphodiesterase class I)/GGDEF domain-containing protein